MYGFFLDGEDGQQPIIMGLIGFNQYETILDKSESPFKPFNGYTKGVDTVAKYSLRTTPETPSTSLKPGEKPKVGDDAAEAKEGDGAEGVNSVVGANGTRVASDLAEQDRGTEEYALAKPTVCEPIPLGKIQKEILATIKEIEKAKKSLTDWKSNVSSEITLPIRS